MTRQSSIFPFIAAMTVVVVASNILVQYPFGHFGLQELLTWGAFTYPFAFLVNDLTNRRFGVLAARKVVVVGFVCAVILSIWLASPRIAVASGTAFLTAQLIDVVVFDKLRERRWWKGPLASSLIGSSVDTVLFFSLAFATSFAFLDTGLGREDGSLGFPVTFLGFQIPLWMSLAFGDFCVKVLLSVAMLAPYRLLLNIVRPMAPAKR